MIADFQTELTQSRERITLELLARDLPLDELMSHLRALISKIEELPDGPQAIRSVLVPLIDPQPDEDPLFDNLPV